MIKKLTVWLLAIGAVGCWEPAARCQTDDECLERAMGKAAYCDPVRKFCFYREVDAGKLNDAGSDAGRSDAGTTDSGVLDAGSMDGGSTDGGSMDGGSMDGGSTDAGSTDAGSTDAGSTDAGSNDAGAKQTWTVAGSQDGGGYFLASAVLDDGRVLFGQGSDFSGRTLRFHPNSGQWSDGAPVPNQHLSAPYTSISSNRILVAGGSNTNFVLASAELYDPATNAWSPTGSLMNARAGHTATRLADGRVLIAGGSNTALVAIAEIYDPISGTFSETGPMQFPRGNASATLLGDGRVLVAGGQNLNSVGERRAELFDPATGTWTPAGLMNGTGFFNRATRLGTGQVLVLSVNWGTEVFRADAGWTPTAPMIGQDAGTYHTRGFSGLPDGGAMVCGNFPVSPACEFYDAAQNKWVPAPPMNIGRADPLQVLLKDGRVLVAASFGSRADGGPGLEPVPQSEIFW